MFSKFEKFFNVENVNGVSDGKKRDILSLFRELYGGRSFGRGMYRVFSSENIDRWTKIVREAYSDYKKDYELFAYDWLGRCFAIINKDSEEENVIMFEIGTGDILIIPCNFVEFHNSEIPENASECLAKEYFEEWEETATCELAIDQCVGYKVPLYLGGEDDIPNLEISDMEVYWGLLGQIRNKIM